jgi:hypothetical protein
MSHRRQSFFFILSVPLLLWTRFQLAVTLMAPPSCKVGV